MDVDMSLEFEMAIRTWELIIIRVKGGHGEYSAMQCEHKPNIQIIMHKRKFSKLVNQNQRET